MNNEDIRSFNILKRFKVVGLVRRLIIIKDSGFKGLINERKRKKEEKKYNIKKGEYFYDKINYDLKGNIDIVLEKEEFLELIKKELKNMKVNYFVIDGKKDKEYNYISKYDFKNIFKTRAFIYITEKKCNMDSFYYGFNITSDKKINEEINSLINSIEGFKLLANYNNKNTITVKASTFFDADGANYYSGGAERYLIDLHEVCKELGLNLDIYQNANKPYFRKYNNINVIGMAPKGIKPAFSLDYFEKQTKNYIYQTYNKSLLHIYSAFQECFPNHLGPSVGISHGIGWDTKTNKFNNGLDFWNSNTLYIESARMCDKLVSVDNNTANWFQTIDFELGNNKTIVIPNYVDTNEFAPRKDYLKKRDKIVITYPRRLYEPRGLYITLEIVDEVLKKYPNVEFHFVGKGFEEDLKNIEEKIKEHPGKVFCYSKSPFEMPEVYKMSDISLIPTQYSEGTSLSCLEAMASGNIVVASRIGGLTDLILNGHNGYLIEPNSESLLKTIENIIENYDKHSDMKETAIKVAKSFNKNIWKERWKEVIKSFHINKKSENINLIEIYVKNANKLKNKTIEKIKEEINKNNLVYIKSETKVEKDNISSNRIQLIPIDEEIVSKPEQIYIEKECSKKISGAKEI